MGHIKLWDTILDCPKVHGLSDRAFRVWIKALVTALRNGGRNGELPSMETLEFRLRMTAADIESALAELHRRGLIDPCPDNHIGGIPWRIHDWDQWQTPKDRTAAERQARWREKQALRNAQRNGVIHAQPNAQEVLKEEDIPPNPPVGGKKPRKRAPKTSPTPFALPDWLPAQDWADFLDMRNKIRKPATERAQRDIVAQLGRWRSDGYDALAILANSIRNSWQDVFLPKDRNGQIIPPPSKAKPKADSEVYNHQAQIEKWSQL